MEFTLVQNLNTKTSPIAVKPYFNNTMSNMGLEKYGLTLFDGITHHEQLACIERNGIVYYVTGLNEFAPDVKLMHPEEKEARIKQIRTAVAELEKELASNVIVDLEAKDFWNNVKLLKPDNADFWNKISISCGNEPVYLDPKDPFDRIKLYAIEAGGFSIIARSYEDAKSRPVPPKFYLDKVEQTAVSKTEYKKLRNKALAELQKLYDKSSAKLFYIAKAVDISSVQYKKHTPLDILYDNMDRHINGEGTESNKERAAKGFIEAVDTDMEILKIKAIVKDAIFFKYLANKADGRIYHMSSGSPVGKNVAEIIEYLRNPLNEEILNDLQNKVEKLWNS